METDFTTLEEKLGYSFKDKKLLELALTSNTYFKAHPELRWENSARLDFIGDSVVELAVRDELVFRYAYANIGSTTVATGEIVSNKNLARIAGILNLEQFLLNAQFDRLQRAQSNRTMATVLEAIVGAIYRDGGFEAAKKFVTDKIMSGYGTPCSLPNMKSAPGLIRGFIERYHRTPTHKITKVPHRQEFVSEVYSGDVFIATGRGPSKKAAKYEALTAALALKANANSEPAKVLEGWQQGY